MLFQTTDKKVIKILKSVGCKEVKLESNLRDELKIDSVMVMSIIIEIEQKFDVDSLKILPRLSEINIVSDLVEVIDQIKEEENES